MSNKATDRPAFDPYSEFLGLPPGPRPPHLYDLLGVEIFCAHRERIEHAAREQYRRIKPFQDHPERSIRDEIQNIITRVANARTVLTNPEQKALYDEKLAERLKIDRDAMLRERTAARAPEYALIVVAGPAQVGTRLPLLPDNPLHIGSDPMCGLHLPGLRMQAKHVTLTFENEAWRLRSPQACITVVNDQRVYDTTLDEGEAIDLGGYRLLFERIDAKKPHPSSIPPPLSLIVRQGPSIPHPTINAIAPARILIGTCETAVWQLAGKQVSVHHARVAPSGALWEITDLHSDTGTLHDGEKVRSAILTHGDHLAIGRFDIQVSLRK
ncbi:MAG: FHA domain-containing protein [Phycisphaerales bacterium]|nr:FHA domain-containing protein [Phycisphaerales bacterium]